MEFRRTASNSERHQSGKRKLEEPLAGKSTLNRLELVGCSKRYHKIGHSEEAIDRLLADLYIELHIAMPDEIVLDLDATDIPLYGHQPERFFAVRLPILINRGCLQCMHLCTIDLVIYGVLTLYKERFVGYARLLNRKWIFAKLLDRIGAGTTPAGPRHHPMCGSGTGGCRNSVDGDDGQLRNLHRDAPGGLVLSQSDP